LVDGGFQQIRARSDEGVSFFSFLPEDEGRHGLYLGLLENLRLLFSIYHRKDGIPMLLAVELKEGGDGLAGNSPCCGIKDDRWQFCVNDLMILLRADNLLDHGFIILDPLCGLFS
jgi:hypothetical protein